MGSGEAMGEAREGKEGKKSAEVFEEGNRKMTSKEWRNHTDERIAALFAALEETAKTTNQIFIETNRRHHEDWQKTQALINELATMQLEVMRKVDSWLEGLQPRNGKQ
jgi:hypothetical protein